ncbi:MAG: GAF domain-containing protein [Chloroflexi bacterium]|nr:GAF domain-containing protein [Chloroflexota bacterium]
MDAVVPPEIGEQVDLVVRSMVQLLSLKRAEVYLFTDDLRSLELAKAYFSEGISEFHNVPEEFSRVLRSSPYPDEPFTLFAENIHSSNQPEHASRPHHFTNLIAAPMRYDGCLCGVLAGYDDSSERRFIQASELLLIGQTAQTVSVLIQNQSLRQDNFCESFG